MAGPLQDLLITVEVDPLEKISFTDTKNTKVFCEDIDSRWEALSAY